MSLQVLQELSTADRDLVAKGVPGEGSHSGAAGARPRAPFAATDRGGDRAGERGGQAGHVVSRNAGRAPLGVAAIEKDAEGADGLRAEVVTLYPGRAVSPLSLQEVHRRPPGLRPEFDAAFYGGDPDNFTFPRYCLDMTLFRVYENGRPLAVTNHLPWSTTGAEPGEAVFRRAIRARRRLNTVAHLEVLRDSGLPLAGGVNRMRDALVAYGRQGRRRNGRPRICASRSRTR